MSEKSIAVKEQIVSDLTEKVKKAQSIIVVDYRGLSVAEDTAMRTEMRAQNIEYAVIKNNIVLRALNAAGFTGFDNDLKGPTAVAISYDDAIAPAKILVDNATKLKKMKIKAGLIEGKKVNEAEIQTFAKIPAKPVLVAQLLGMLTNPVRSLAVCVSEIAKKKEA